MNVIVRLLSLLPEHWLERALRSKKNVFTVTIIRGDEMMRMAKLMGAWEDFDKPTEKKLEEHANLH